MHKTTKLYKITPDGLVLLLLKPMGLAARSLGNNFLGRFFIGKSYPLMGKTMVYLGRKANFVEQRSAVDIARETIVKFFAPDIQIVEDTVSCFDYTLKKCPYALHSAKHLELCHKMMKWDQSMVAALGGKMEIIDRMPEGKPLCRMRITNAQ